jgi:pyridoxal phosphate enzyme (YggS family)
VTTTEQNASDGIADRLAALRARIARAERAAARPEGSVTLVAVGKTFGADALRSAAAAGIRAFGENYLQEAIAKHEALADLALDWHFIGAVQSNKTRAIAEHFDWVHTIDRVKIARRLADARSPARPPLAVCLQVNVDEEPTKAGVAPTDVTALAREIAPLQGLRLRGLMAIPAPREDAAGQREAFERVAALAAEAAAALPPEHGAAFDVLSMGMSGDLEAAIAAGATHIRIGSALFGPRPRPGGAPS